MPSQHPDPDYIRQLLLSNPAKAMEFVYALYKKSLLRIAYDLTHDPHAAEDVVQEAITHVWFNHTAIANDHSKPILNYLLQITRFQAMRWYNKEISTRNRIIRWLSRQEPRPEHDPPPDYALIRKEKYHYLRQVIATFPPREQECLLLKLSADLTNREIAQRLNISEKAVESTLSRAHKRLRNQLPKSLQN
jgi:RNA polymerase sigma factor (sigma-70 family)